MKNEKQMEIALCIFFAAICVTGMIVAGQKMPKKPDFTDISAVIAGGTGSVMMIRELVLSIKKQR